jgi:hypothetical protein
MGKANAHGDLLGDGPLLEHKPAELLIKTV